MLLALGLATTARAAAAQTIRGRVLDATTELPVASVSLILLDGEGREERRSVADSTGEFRFGALAPGRYAIRSERLGYQAATTPALDLQAGRTLEIDLLLAPTAARLAPVTVRERRDYYLGMNPRSLGIRPIDREQVEPHLGTARDVGDLLRAQRIAGLTVSALAGGELCVRLARTRSGGRQCMAVFLNGARRSDAGPLDPADVEKMVLLLPHEAGVLFGEETTNGVLLIWTRDPGKKSKR